MKAAAVDYVRATSMAHALALLAEHGEDARLLAGGQSLVPALNLRMVSAGVLVDISRLEELRFVERRGDHLAVGALTRHSDLMTSPLIAADCPLVAEAVRHVAHPAIRNRGTLGGNLAHADPASELPACMLALEAVIVAAGPSGERRIAAEDFFTGIYETSLQPGEALVRVEIPLPRPDQRFGFLELARRGGDYALAGLAVRITLGQGGSVADARLAFLAVGDRPTLARSAAATLTGQAPTPALLAQAQNALEQDLEPQDDLQASAAMRLHLSRVLLERVLGPLLPGLTPARPTAPGPNGLPSTPTARMSA